MGQRWMWMGMMGLCTLASGCRESDSPDTVDVPATTMQARDTANGGLWVPATPALAQGTTGDARPTPLPGANAEVPPNTAPPPGNLPVRDTQMNEPARTTARAPTEARTSGSTAQAPGTGGSGTAQAPANTPTNNATAQQAPANAPANNATAQQAPANAPAYGGSGPAQAPVRGGMAQQAPGTPARDPAVAPPQGAAVPNANATPGSQAAQANANGQPATQAPPEGRVMIGAQAVQANDDESWYEGAAKAAQAAVTDNTADRPLEQVTIATSTVNGRVTRANRDTLHVRDGEGTVYELQLDPRSRGLRQGQRVPLTELREGTPVRASFALIGGRTVARDVQVRR
ncbi:hypothetical protein OV208_34000 [Corallococcus sp. bb12-1]|uniref:hypothetical protein n=1 Tax=Corallococcus sp. bb12-1 TaxID=2996784 RepID=UPI00226E4B4F|nr:hypothetical protein [Corallococcus sp. bb12-1]MCY1046368.1 hypothetical protein [Corallococcus sp. bb12-1]